MIKIETPIKDFYNIVASEFDITRVRIWNCVKEYLNIQIQANILIGQWAIR